MDYGSKRSAMPPRWSMKVKTDNCTYPDLVPTEVLDRCSYAASTAMPRCGISEQSVGSRDGEWMHAGGSDELREAGDWPLPMAQWRRKASDGALESFDHLQEVLSDIKPWQAVNAVGKRYPTTRVLVSACTFSLPALYRVGAIAYHCRRSLLPFCRSLSSIVADLHMSQTARVAAKFLRDQTPH